MKYTCIWLLVITSNLFAQTFVKESKVDLISVGSSSSLAFDADNDGRCDVFIMGKNGPDYYTRLYHNNGDSTFRNLGLPFSGLAYGDADFLDYNNDSLLDLVFCGFDGVDRRFCLFRNLGNNVFSEVEVAIPGVDYSAVKCADFNNDGLTDIAVAGETPQSNIFYIYKNEGDGNFSLSTTLEGIYDGSMAVGDINNDAYPDIISTGVNNSLQIVSRIYINSKENFLFNERTSNLTPTRGGSIKLVDLNNDGYTDVIITGKTSSDKYISEVYSNYSGEFFVLNTTLKGLFYSTIASGDFSNDGFSDLILAGLDSTLTYRTACYRNSSGSGFSSYASSVSSMIRGSISPLDMNDDKKLDVLICGFTPSDPVSSVYLNNPTTENLPPDAPGSLISVSSNDTVILSWTAPADDKTSPDALSYDVYIKDAYTDAIIKAAPVRYSDGKRLIYRSGQIQDTFLVITNLPYGKYTWSVQAVDPGYLGSAFASEESFNICYDIDLGADSSICYNDTANLTAGTSMDLVRWYSSNNPSAWFQTGINASMVISDDTKIWVTVTKPVGCVLTDTINLVALPLPESGMPIDSGICTNALLSLSLSSATYKGNWSSLEGSISAQDTSSVNYTVLHDDIIYIETYDTLGCRSFDTLAVTAYPAPESNIPSEFIICQYDTLQLTAGKSSDMVSWSDTGNTVISSERELKYRIDRAQTLYVRVTDSIQCENTDTLAVSIMALPYADAGQDTLICSGTNASLGGHYINPADYVFSWYPAGSLNDPDILHPEAFPDITTSYIIRITDNNACSNYDTITVSINPVSIIDIDAEEFICEGDSVMLGGAPTATGSLLPYSYNWSPENSLENSFGANPTAHPVITTQYRLILSTGACIVDTLFTNVIVWPLPSIIKSDDIVIGSGSSTLLHASGGREIEWVPETGLDNYRSSNPVASPDTTTIYTVYVTDENGCTSHEQVVVTIRNEIYVPSLFTPNGDQNNDYFRVYGTGIEKISLRVYSAEGILVYETNSVEEALETGWDGNYHGNPLESGKYLWVIEAYAVTGEKMEYNGLDRGIVTLLK